MAYKEFLPTTNLQAIDIRDTISCPSNNLSHYCCLAKSGGKPYGDISLAFNTIEVGGSHYDGELIKGAVPYFNIYSKNAPGEWQVHLGEVMYRLRRNRYGDQNINGVIFGSSSYCYDAGSFGGHEIKSRPPYINNITGKPLQGNKIIGCTVCRGDYDWFAMVAGIYDDITIDELYVGLSSATISGEFEKVKYSEWGKDDYGPGVTRMTFTTGSRPSSITISVNLFRKMGDIQMKQLLTIPMETSLDGNGGFDSSHTAQIEWEEYYSNPEVIGVEFFSGWNSDAPGEKNRTYTIGTPEGWSGTDGFHFSIRVHPDRTIIDAFAVTGELYYPPSSNGDPAGSVVLPDVGVHVARQVTPEEAENNPGLEVGDRAWEVSGMVSTYDIPSTTTVPYKMMVSVFNTLFM